MTVVPKIRQASLGRFIELPENQAAVLAARDVLDYLAKDETHSTFPPLFLHGPSGVGKSFLLTGIARETKRLGRSVVHLSGRELRLQPRTAEGEPEESIFTAQLGEQALSADVFILEDLQSF